MKEYIFSTKDLQVYDPKFTYDAIQQASEMYKNHYLHSVEYSYDNNTFEHKWTIKMASKEEMG